MAWLWALRRCVPAGCGLNDINPHVNKGHHLLVLWQKGSCRECPLSPCLCLLTLWRVPTDNNTLWFCLLSGGRAYKVIHRTPLKNPAKHIFKDWPWTALHMAFLWTYSLATTPGNLWSGPPGALFPCEALLTDTDVTLMTKALWITELAKSLAEKLADQGHLVSIQKDCNIS